MMVSAYIDGFNFYEASKNKRWYPYGWCNWKKTIERCCPGAEVSVKYFTSAVSPRNRGAKERQDLHIRAMKEVAKAEIIRGTFRERNVMCRACNEQMRCPRCGKDVKLTEKQTDVNIAIHLLGDSVDRTFDRAYLVTADIDIIPAISAALRRNVQSEIRVLFPPDSMTAQEFDDLQREFGNRARCQHLDVNFIERFAEDLPARWGLELPKHWRLEAGPRPRVVEDNQTLRRPKKSAVWWEN
jgi:uncharacterized LabA/DUF88 family protein